MKSILANLLAGESLSVERSVGAFEQIMSGQATHAQIAAMLSLIQSRGPTADEVIGAAKVMRAKAKKVSVPPGLTVIDTCGTGGDQAHTFNISTAAALVAAGAGRPRGVAVAKHGNRSVTSKSGSSQVLEVLGVKLEVCDETLTRCLDEAGMCFCFAPSHHPAMKHVASVRQELGFRTLFNLLGPLTNPAEARRQVIGVYAPDLTDLVAQVLLSLGSQHAMVVHGHLYNEADTSIALDELTTNGMNRVSHLRYGVVRTYDIDPATLGFAIGHPASLHADGPETSAQTIRSVLAGKHGPARDIVCLNAAAALLVADVAGDLSEGLEMAAQAIDSQAAAGALETLVRVTHSAPTPARPG